MNNGCLQSQFDERERERERKRESMIYLSRRLGCSGLKALARFRHSLLFFYPLTQEDRKRLCSVAGRVNRQKQCHILIWDLFTIPSPTSFNICCLIIGIRFCSLFNEWTTNKAFSLSFNGCVANWVSMAFIVADPGTRPRGPVLLTFRPNWGPKGWKNFFGGTVPPVISGSRWPAAPLSRGLEAALIPVMMSTKHWMKRVILKSLQASLALWVIKTCFYSSFPVKSNRPL